MEARPTENLTNPDEECFNELLVTLLNGQQDLQKQSLNMIQDITCRQEYDNLMKNIPIYDGKNMDLVDWLLQIENVASSTHSQEYELGEVFFPIATKVHTASDLHHKQRPDETLQEYIQNFTDLTKKYEGLVYNRDQTIAEINEIIDLTSNMKVNNQ